MRSLPALLITQILLSSALSAQSFSASQPAFSTPPQALREAFSKIEPDGKTALILLEEASYEFDAQGRQAHRHRMIFKVLTKEAAEDWAMITRTWAPWEEERPVIHARVISQDGSVHELDAKTVADAPASDNGDDVLSDRRKVRAPLPAMEAGAIVEQEILTKQTVAPLGTGAIESFDFGASVPVAQSILRVRLPEKSPFHFVKRLLPDLAVSDHTEGGIRQITFEQAAMKPLPDLPSFLPPDEPRSPRVTFSTADNWGAVARAYSAIVDKQLDGFDAKKYLPKFPVGASRDAKILAIVHYLNHDIRYTGIEFSEAALVPHRPEEVLAHQFGDCKDKSTLEVALLRAAGIDAHVALLQSSIGEDIEPEMPGLDRFNHAIVYVGGDAPVWLDPTDTDLTLRTVSAGNQGRYALIAQAQTAGLIRTPEMTAEQNRVVERREFELPELGRSKIVETSESYGTPDRAYRGTFGGQDEKKLRETLKDYVQWTYGEAKIKSITTAEEADLSKPYQLKIELTDAQRGTTGRTEAAVAIRPSQLTARLPEFFRSDPKEKKDEDEKAEEAKPRTVDFVISEPYTHELHYAIKVPVGFRLRQLPEAVDEKLGPATLTGRFASAGPDSVTADFRFVMPKRRFSAAEGLALRDAAVELEKQKMILVYFDQVGETDLASGKVKDAITEFAVLGKQHPQEALHAMQMARAMLAAGAGNTARAEAERAVALEPSAKAYVQLAEVLKHDLVGRPMGKGYDRDGAEAAYRKALELDPSDNESRANLAILLEYDRDGVRYASGAKLSEAIAEYAKVLNKLDGLGVGRNYPVAMLRGGQIKELKAYLQKQSDDEKDAVLRVCVDAILNGLDAGLKRAREVSGVEAQRRVLASAAQTLMLVRRYELAGGVMSAAAVGAPNPAALTNVADILKNTKRLEDIPQTVRDPEDAVRVLMLKICLAGGRGTEWLQLLSSYMTADIKPGDTKSMERIMEGLSGKAQTAGMSENAEFEIGLSAMRWVRDGSDENGWVVRMNVPATGQNSSTLHQTWYVIREGGSYRILDGNGDYSGIARLVLDLVKDGKLAQARVWLDRVREEAPAGNGDDPLSGAMFSRVWQPGKDAGAEEIRTAAAMLLSGEFRVVPGVAGILEKAAKSASAATSDAITVSLAEAYYFDKQYAKALAIDQGLLQKLPRSATALRLTIRDACAAEGQKGAERIADAQLDKFKNDLMALRGAASMLSACGDGDRASAISKQIVDSGRAQEMDYNQFAWATLIAGKVTPATLETASHGVMGNSASPAMTHTMAAVEAELDKPSEARAMILQRMTEMSANEPDDDDWFVFGRIAECYGLRDEAIAMYKKLERPENEFAIAATSYALAQKRLAGLK